MDFYGILVLRDTFLERKTKAFAFQGKKVYLGEQMLPEKVNFIIYNVVKCNLT